MPEVVYLKTRNPQKLEEYKRILGRHRVVVEQVDHDADPEELFGRSQRGRRVIAVLQEESNLYGPGKTEQPLSTDQLLPLRQVANITRLRVLVRDGVSQALTPFLHEARVDGFITGEKKDEPSDVPVFGWDRDFVSRGTQMTYHEMRMRGLKLSARDLVAAEFTDRHLSFRGFRDLVADPQHPERTVDFRRRPIQYVAENPHLNNPNIEMYGLRNLQRKGLNLGPFFRASKNRRENIYWCPGGNGGLPYTPKIDKTTGAADRVHETTYFDHDLGHHILNPDLIYEGATDPLSIRVQTVWRMMSEALTLVKADMLFVDTLVKSGVEYDFSRRKIYPLFESLKADFNEGENLRKLYHANVRYALLGDDSVYKELGADPAALEGYKGKYNAYFVEDYRWTQQNIKNMSEMSGTFEKWRKSVQPLMKFAQYTEGCITVSSCVEMLQARSPKPLDELTNEELVDLMYAMVFETTIEPGLTGPEIEVDDDKGLKSGFLKYMMAQLFIFDVYDFIPESNAYRARIIQFLEKRIDVLTQEDIITVRAHYSDFVNILAERKAITEEEQGIYKEIFPLFPPFYINYDKTSDSYEDIAAVSSRILGAPQAF